MNESQTELKTKQGRARVRRARIDNVGFVDEAHGCGRDIDGIRQQRASMCGRGDERLRRDGCSQYDVKERRRIARWHKRRGDSVRREKNSR